MSARKKLSEKQIKSRLTEEARDPKAWGKAIIVPPSRHPRPEQYGRSTHLQLAANFYVLSVLHRLGAEANLMLAQSDNVDIAVVRRSGEACTIDVKTLAGTNRWSIEPFKARKDHFLVFILFAREWQDPQVVPDIYIWSSETLRDFIAHCRRTTVSLKDVASKLDPISAWSDFLTHPAA